MGVKWAWTAMAMAGLWLCRLSEGAPADWSCCRPCPSIHFPEIDDQYGRYLRPGDIDFDTGFPVKEDYPKPEKPPDLSLVDDPKDLEGFGRDKCCKTCPEYALASFIELHEATYKLSTPVHFNESSNTYYPKNSRHHSNYESRSSRNRSLSSLKPPAFLEYVSSWTRQQREDPKTKMKEQPPKMEDLRYPDDPTLVVEMPPCCLFCHAQFYAQDQYSDIVALPYKLSPAPDGEPLNYQGPILEVSRRRTGKEIIFAEVGSEYRNSKHKRRGRKTKSSNKQKSLSASEAEAKSKFFFGFFFPILAKLVPKPPAAPKLPKFEAPDKSDPCCQQCPAKTDAKPIYKWGPPVDA